MNIRYDMASKADITELTRLRIAYLTADFGELTGEQAQGIADEVPAYFERHLNQDFFAHVARADGRIVGTCWLLLTEKPASVAFPHGRTGSIFNVYVEPEYRRQGIARTLMLQLIDQARELMLDRIELRATAMGHDLYQSIGFVDDESTHRAMNYVMRYNRPLET